MAQTLTMDDVAICTHCHDGVRLEEGRTRTCTNCGHTDVLCHGCSTWADAATVVVIDGESFGPRCLEEIPTVDMVRARITAALEDDEKLAKLATWASGTGGRDADADALLAAILQADARFIQSFGAWGAYLHELGRLVDGKELEGPRQRPLERESVTAITKSNGGTDDAT